jgi:F-type H+-transporting ATPase subunit b
MAGEAANAFQVADVAPEPHGDPAAEPLVTEELHTSTEHAGDAHAAKPGLPQLDTTTFASQLFWFFISFAVLYFVISRIAAPKIGGVIADRAGRIKGDLDSAAQAKRDSEAAMAGYDKALADARAKALKASDQMRNAVQTEINASARCGQRRWHGSATLRARRRRTSWRS